MHSGQSSMESSASVSSTDVAIIGMACIFPGAPDVQTYWQNIVNKVDAITDPPAEWEAELFFDPDSHENDRIYCKRGGYLGDLAQFNPLDYGIMPNSVHGGEPDHFLALQVAYAALADAGYQERPFDRNEVEVILGKGTYINPGHTNLIQHGVIIDQTIQILRQLHPEHSEEALQELKQRLKASLPPFNPEMVPALVPNIVTGRIANRLGLMGANFTVDAACASSLIAVERGIQDLLAHKCDLAIVGGVHGSMPPPILMIFCQLNALSRRGQIRPFDKDADGTLLGQGTGVLVLKRRAEAERDGDRIYALIKGIGTASDGRALGLLAPRVEGEELALQRAYTAAGVSPGSVGLIEAHGTGTPVGDMTEIQALNRVFSPHMGKYTRCGVGSVKSMISHLIPAAGVAGLIKAALALHHKVLPPTLHCDEPHPALELEKTPFYINSETRPWIHGGLEPRRAGVNAFGFGGINAHAVLEEYRGPNVEKATNFLHAWESELFLIQATSRTGVLDASKRLQEFLTQQPEPVLKDLAYTLNCPFQHSGLCLAIVATTVQDLKNKLSHAIQRLTDPSCTQIKDRSGIFFCTEPLSRQGSLAFVFPGEGSQYINMLADLCLHFPEVRACFDQADHVFLANGRQILPSHFVFPPPLTPATSSDQGLWQMDMAVSAVFSANRALARLLDQLEIRPQALAGHSSGEFVALLASGAVAIQDEEQLMQHCLHLNSMHDSLLEQVPEAALLAVGAADTTLVMTAVAESDGALTLAMDNCPHQVILCGSQVAVSTVAQQLQSQGAVCNLLAFNRAYHTASFQPVCKHLAPFFDRLRMVSPHTTLYSCATAQPYPQEPAAIRQLALDQWAQPVRFREMIEAMYAEGVRMFVEVGPKGNLTGFIDDILRNRRYLAVPTNVQRLSGIRQIHHLIGLLAAHGVAMCLDHLYKRRAPRRLALDAGMQDTAKPQQTTTSIRLSQELPRLRLGQDTLNGLRKMSSTGPSAFSTPHLASNGDKPPHQVLQQQTTSMQQSVDKQRPLEPSSLPLVTTPPYAPQSAGRTQVMQEYLQTMERFLHTQQGIMTQFLAKVRSQTSASPGIVGNGKVQFAANNHHQVSPASFGPFGLTISSQTIAEQVTATCQLDLNEHLFLRDHTIGRAPSILDKTLTGLPVVPLTVSLEIMAQVATLLFPDQQIVTMKNVRAHRWIEVGESGCTLVITAKRVATTEGEVVVRIQESDTASSSKPDQAHLRVEGTLVFARHYPKAPRLTPFDHHATRSIPWNPAQYYDVMFHGSCFQCVTSIDQLGENSAEATLKVLPTDQLFRSCTQPAFLIDPVLLDGAGQVVGFWTWDHFETGFTIFPTGFEALYLYGPFPTYGESVKCYVRITQVADARVRSSIDLVGPEGRLVAQLVAWEDMRFFDWSRQFANFVLAPTTTLFSVPWQSPLVHLPVSLGLKGCQILESGSGIWSRVLAYLILNRCERETWSQITGPEKRRREWLLGRLAAKDAVRLLLYERYGLSLAPVDIEIVVDDYGRPSIAKELVEQVGCRLSLSIAHSADCAVAVAGEWNGNQGIGIDLELMGLHGQVFDALKQGALTVNEQGLLAALPTALQEEWLLRLWCAKEAVAKALGRGLAGNPLHLIVQQLDVETGRVTVALAGELARQLQPDAMNRELTAHTGLEDNFVFASSLV